LEFFTPIVKIQTFFTSAKSLKIFLEHDEKEQEFLKQTMNFTEMFPQDFLIDNGEAESKFLKIKINLTNRKNSKKYFSFNS